MMKLPLSVRNILERPKDLFPNKEIYSKTRGGDFRYTYEEFYRRVCRLANVLSRPPSSRCPTRNGRSAPWPSSCPSRKPETN